MSDNSARFGAREPTTEPEPIKQLELSKVVDNFTILERRDNVLLACDFEYVYVYKWGPGRSKWYQAKQMWCLHRQVKLKGEDTEAIDAIWRLARKYREE